MFNLRFFVFLLVTTFCFAQERPVAAIDPKDNAKPVASNLVRISGGTFTMGSPDSEAERFDGEIQHQVTVSDFYMGKYQVTQAEYLELMGENPSHFKGNNLPVENVSWYDTVEYCNKLSQREGLEPAYTISGENVTWNRNANGYRLPTEAEWEYACRAGTTTPFSTGYNITTGQANYNGDYPYSRNPEGIYRQTTVEVGSFASNPWGLYDMHGNVLEWCWDWKGEYSVAPQTDPVGASSGSDRVFRGGSWNIDGRYVRSAYRDSSTPSDRAETLGFRVVRPQFCFSLAGQEQLIAVIDPKDNAKPVASNLVRISGGTFTMGSPASEEARDDDEIQHLVTVNDFYMGKYQVTQAEYQELMGENPSHFKGNNLPVENVSWYDAVGYCNRLSQREGLKPAYTISGENVTWNRNANGYRLPTEAEWEYACRAGTTTPFSTGYNITTSQANYDQSGGQTTPVGSFASNPWGLYDMHGNVWEWCWDLYGAYSVASQKDPVGASSGSDRVLRGGSWRSSGPLVRSADRDYYTPSDRYNNLGFRVVRLSQPLSIETVVLVGSEANWANAANEKNLRFDLINKDEEYCVYGNGNKEHEVNDDIKSVAIPSEYKGKPVTMIGNTAFHNYLSLASVTIPNGVTMIGESAFYNCISLSNFTIPDSVTTIGESAFYGTGIKNIVIPDSVTTLGNGTFYKSSLESVVISNSLTTIENGVFEECSLTSVIIPNSVTTIKPDAFKFCEKLTSVTIGNSVTMIGDKAFSNCISLTSIVIPNSVILIGEEAFIGCENLTAVTFERGDISINDSFAFDGDLVEKYREYGAGTYMRASRSKTWTKNSSEDSEFARFIPSGKALVKAVKGDLNGDGLEDVVLMVVGTDESQIVNGKNYNQYGIIILFNKEGSFEIALQNLDLTQRYEGDEDIRVVDASKDIKISRGNLIIHFSYMRSSSSYTFRYRNSEFELIGEDYGYNTGEEYQDTSINYLSKRKKIVSGNDTNRRIKPTEKWEDIEVKNLKKLSEISGIE